MQLPFHCTKKKKKKKTLGAAESGQKSHGTTPSGNPHMCQLILGGVQSDQLTADVKESFLMTRLCVEAIRMSAQK